MKASLASLPLLGAALVCGCKPVTKFTDPGAVETLDADFGSTDLQLHAEKMVQSLLRHPVLGEGKRPVLALGSIDNRTNEHIDTTLILDKISTALLQSGKCRLAAGSQGQAEVSQQISHQQSGVVSADTAKAFGKQVGADFVLYGRLTNIEKKGGGTELVYYNFNLNLVNVETALIEWKEEKEIAKKTSRAKFGW